MPPTIVPHATRTNTGNRSICSRASVPKRRLTCPMPWSVLALRVPHAINRNKLTRQARCFGPRRRKRVPIVTISPPSTGSGPFMSRSANASMRSTRTRSPSGKPCQNRMSMSPTPRHSKNGSKTLKVTCGSFVWPMVFTISITPVHLRPAWQRNCPISAAN